MKSLQVPEQPGALNAGKAKHRLANLSSLIGLSAGALGWSSLAHAGYEGRVLQTLILPNTYSALDDGIDIQRFEIAQDQTEEEEDDEGLLLGGASSGLIGAYQADPGNKSSAGSTYLISGYTLDLTADGTGVATAGMIDMAADLGLG